MDDNFFIPQSPKKDSPNEVKAISELLKKFLPVFMLTMLMPMFVFFTITPPDLRFLTRADQNRELRVWFEPSTIVAKKGDSVELKVMTLFESDSVLIPSMSLAIVPQQGIVANQNSLTYKQPFKGQVIIGTVTVKPTKSGTFSIDIPKEQVQVNNYKESLTIITTPGRVIVNQ
jgi:hypothetical protein